MATANAPKTFSDLYNALMARVRADASNSITKDQAKQYIDLGLMDMHIGYGEKFAWAERKSDILTHASYSAGTVSISVGSTTLTGTSTLWTTTNAYGVANARAGGKIVLAGGQDVYEVASVGGAGTITLATRYVGSAALSAESYVYFEDEYDLAVDFLKPIDAQKFDTMRSIELISRTDFRRMYPRVNTTGQIVSAALFDRAPSGNTAPRRRIRFWRPPSTTIIVPYAYVTKYLVTTSAGVAAENLTNDDDEPIVPWQYRNGIVLHGLKNWYRDKKDDPRSGEVTNEYTDFILRITADGDVAQPRMKLQPRVGNYRRAAARPYSGARTRYDTNGAFDRMER